MCKHFSNMSNIQIEKYHTIPNLMLIMPCAGMAFALSLHHSPAFSDIPDFPICNVYKTSNHTLVFTLVQAINIKHRLIRLNGAKQNFYLLLSIPCAWSLRRHVVESCAFIHWLHVIPGFAIPLPPYVVPTKSTGIFIDLYDTQRAPWLFS